MKGYRMTLPKVAIVGRPNVGKSTLFNVLVGRRISIEDSNAGITRDRVTAEATLAGRRLELIDTGGIGIVDADNLTEDVERQIEIAMTEADVIIFVADVRDGVAPLDREVARRLRKLGKPTIMVVNKADTPGVALGASEFIALGMAQPFPVSAKGKIGLEELREAIAAALEGFPAEQETPAAQGPLKLAIVGKRNSGKSTLVNYLAGEARVIVSEVPGTTRDSVDVPFEFEGARYLAIDTAGLRKRSSVKASVDFFSIHRTQRSIRRSDVTILLLDCTKPLSEVDKKLADYIVAEHKPTVVALNKYDLAGDVEPKKFSKYIAANLTGLAFAPMVFMSAKTGFNIDGLLTLAQDLYAQANCRVTTGELNRIVKLIYQTRRPRVSGRRLPKIYYVTQSAVAPPTIVFFVSNPGAFDENYVRYVENSLRKALPCSEVPIKIVFRDSGKREETE
jgi:GTP-binding protein